MLSKPGVNLGYDRRRKRLSWILSAGLALALALALAATYDVQGQTPTCSNGNVVPDPATNTELVADCIALLSIEATLDPSGTVNWAEDTAIGSWDGVTVDGSTQRVTKLELRGISLNGSIPAGIGDFSGLVRLDLATSGLTGTLPTELGNLLELQDLDLRSNGLTGPLPTELGSLSKLQLLMMTKNQVTGSIPTELGNLGQLRTLQLGLNQLSGSVPIELGSLSNLESLDLQQNQLSNYLKTERTGWGRGEIPLDPPFAKGGDTEETPI